ncbi:serine/threonine-protein kinase ULK4-like isoform 2-T2 [Syngnathus typhle]
MENINLYEELGRDSTSVVYKGRRMGSLNYVALKCSDKAKRPEITNHVGSTLFLHRYFSLASNESVMFVRDDSKVHTGIFFLSFFGLSRCVYAENWIIQTLSVFTSGGTLESVIIRDRCLPEDVARKFGWDLVQGLEHIHKLGIVLSDLTPAKILLDSSGVLKLGNFCYSKMETDTLEGSLACEEAGNRKHQDIMVKKSFQGSPIYMAPEILQGSETTSISDLWALGCVLYYTYTGKPPFYSGCYSQLKEMILGQEAAAPTQKVSPTIPPSQEFQHLLKRLLNKNPEKRMNLPELLKHSFWTAKDKN